MEWGMEAVFARGVHHERSFESVAALTAAGFDVVDVGLVDGEV